MDTKLTWRDVLDIKDKFAGRNIHDIIPFIENTGYEFFSWNGEIYEFVHDIDGNTVVIKTIVKTIDL